MNVTPDLSHRGGWSLMVERAKPDPTLFKRVGGKVAISRLVDGLYDRIESDPQLLPLFRHDLAQERANQKRFFARWMGGKSPYDGYRGVRSRHRNKVSAEGARRWLGHFSRALKEAEFAPDLVREIMQVLVPLANALVDDKPMLQCQEWYRKPAADVAKGDLGVFKDWVARHPELLEPGPAQLMMHSAARRGRREIVDYLLDSGVDVNLPNCSQTEVAVTPYAIARSSRHHELADYLLRRGAKVDIFSLVWLGQLEPLEDLLREHPELVNADDPAQDFQEVRPLEHAVMRGKPKVAEFLLERGADLKHRGRDFVSRAVDKRRAPLLKLLLDRGAKVSHVGPGRWLVDEKLAPILLQQGVKVSRFGAAWVEYCTGHHGNRERPELIEALLEQGVDIEARSHKKRTALHCATRVGYTKVLDVLLKAGADLQARDVDGNTPLHYVFLARPKVDREATARVLLAYGADPDLPNKKGQTPRQKAKEAGFSELMDSQIRSQDVNLKGAGS